MISIHVDVDNIWIWEEESGLKVPYSQELMFDQAMPTLLELFERYSIKSTFFIVGKDLHSKFCRDFCVEASQKGHEIANHTTSHPLAVHNLSRREKEYEIRECDELISSTINKKPVGFRAPGYYIDQDMVDVLIKYDYLYDTTVLPGVAVFAMRIFRALNRSFSAEKTFGRNRYLFTSRSVTRLFGEKNKDRFIYEIPISVAPFLRTPIHSTFLYFFGTTYFKTMLSLLDAYSTHIVYLFHAVDALRLPHDEALERNVLPLRQTFERRTELIDLILYSLNELKRPFSTTEQMIAKFDDQLIGRSSV